MKFEDHIQYVIKAHGDHPRKPGNATRRFDGRTPYSIHPIWCAMTICAETSLPAELREIGSLALLYHDLLEETTVRLPDELTDEEKKLIQEMTSEAWAVPEGSAVEEREIWSRRQEVRLLKLYDKTSNLLDGSWMPPEKLKRYRRYTSSLADDVQKNYGDLNIVRIARAILANK
jgi:hypothetical protein